MQISTQRIAFRQMSTADAVLCECRMFNVPVQRPGKIEERHMHGRLGRLGQHQMPRPSTSNGAARQLERPRSRSVPRDMRCST